MSPTGSRASTQRRCGLRTSWAGRWTLLEGCHPGSADRPSPTGSLPACSLPLLCYHDTDSLGCGRGRHRFDARCTLDFSLAHGAVARCAVAVQQPTSRKLRTRQDGRTVSRV
eukprot:3596694-Prymnesium_polylepis.1